MKILKGILTGVLRVVALLVCYCWVLPLCLLALLPMVLVAMAAGLVLPVVEACSRKARQDLQDILVNEFTYRGRDCVEWVMGLL